MRATHTVARFSFLCHAETMKKIIVFSTAYLPLIGGAEVAIKEIAERLSDTYEFHLITARLKSELAPLEKIGPITVHRIGVGIPLIDKLVVPFLGAFVAKRLSDKDTLYWNMMVTYASGASYIANMLPWGTRQPVVLTIQEGDSPEYLSRRWLGLIALSWKMALARSATVTVISTYLGRMAAHHGYSGEVVLVPNGVDVARFEKPVSPAELEQARIRLHKKEGDVFLITTSRLVTKNAVDTVIRALALMPGHVHFVVLGTGADEMMLRDLAQKLGVSERVRWMGAVPNNEIIPFLKVCDIFIRPARSEGMGISFIEAMAAGLPVIATQEGGIADFLFDAARNSDVPTTGWAVDVDAPQQIVDAVRDITEHQEKVRAVVETAQRMVHEKYDWTLIAHMMREVFEQASARADIFDRPLLRKALAIATVAHRGQKRKMSGHNFITHPIAVAQIVADAGGSDEAIAAALLHDVLEDTTYSPSDMEKVFGPRVHTIVRTLSEDKALPWSERKRAYIESVRCASDEVKLVSIADKIHNFSSMLTDLDAAGSDLWDNFGGGREGQLTFAHDMLEMFRESWQHPLIAKFGSVLERFKILS